MALEVLRFSNPAYTKGFQNPVDTQVRWSVSWKGFGKPRNLKRTMDELFKRRVAELWETMPAMR